MKQARVLPNGDIDFMHYDELSEHSLITAWKQAQEAGYTQIKTFGGWINLSDWTYPQNEELLKHTVSYTLEGNKLVSAWHKVFITDDQLGRMVWPLQ